jgi:ERCC4-related helicase
VGLGKTIETGLILRYLIVSQRVRRVLVLAPASVQPQWHDELREKFNLYFWSYNQGNFQDPFGQTALPSENPWNTKNVILASSHLVRRQDRMQELLDAEPWDLVVLDEAHHARRKAPQQRKETPNRLLELLQDLRHNTQSLILLSATPMQIDTIEVFDLLNVLGLQGHWSYGISSVTTLPPYPRNPTISCCGSGKPCPPTTSSGGTTLPSATGIPEKSDRMLSFKLDDVWMGKNRLINLHQYLKDKQFLDASRQYLSTNTPLKDLMFRHTRDTLREYYRLGLLEKDVPTREVFDHAIVLEPLREAELYRQVSDYVRHFYRLAQKENRKALGFLMTLYRKRLTSSFYAMEQSLQRRLDALITQQGSGLSEDDLLELEDADDAVIQGLESYMEPVHPTEIEYLEEILRQFENTGEDSKFSHLLTVLRQALSDRESAIIFTQYTDTMDFLRGELMQLYGGNQMACYSGRGGEIYQSGEWVNQPKEQIKRQFREGTIQILLCTESASEGLNLQTCGVLINYDMPWNPMRVEQRIGRIDRIGQRYPTVSIHNFYYDGTVEAKVYKRLRDRIHAFSTVVGNLQPILAQVPTFIEQALSSVDPEEEDVLLSEFDQVLDTPPLRPTLDEMVKMDVEADLADIHAARYPSPLTISEMENQFTTSKVLGNSGINFTALEDHIWQISLQGKNYKVTFHPSIFDERSSLHLMSYGDPLFERLLKEYAITSREPCPVTSPSG